MTGAEELALIQLGMATIEKIVETVKAARAGTIDHVDAAAKITSFHDELAAHNAAAAKIVRDRFDPGGTTP